MDDELQGAPPPDPQEPDTGEPAASDGEASQNTPDPQPVDWEARFKGLSTKFDQAQRLLKQREDQLLTRGNAAPEPESGDNALPPQVARELDELRKFRAEQEWTVARTDVGDQVADAYEVFYRGYQIDNTPKGALAAFVASIQYLAEQAPTGGAAKKPTRSQAVEPRVDPNRSDTPDTADLDKQIEAAKAGKGKDPLGAFINASLRKAGL